MADQITWTSPDGDVIDLTDPDSGVVLDPEGTRGLNAPGWDMTVENYAGVDGVTVQSISAKAAEITLGLLVEASSETEFRARRRALIRRMRPRRRGVIVPGTLSFLFPDGERRSIDCYAIDGLAGDESNDARFAHSWRLALKLFGPDAWWYGDVKTLKVGLGAPTPFFPFFPLQLSSSVVQGSFTVDLTETDTETFPVWTITGPGSSLVLTNETTGKVIEVNAAIDSGEIMVINTQSGQQSVRLGDGTNLMEFVASDPALWSLIDDVNEVTASLPGATSESRIVGAYVPRYSGI